MFINFVHLLLRIDAHILFKMFVTLAESFFLLALVDCFLRTLNKQPCVLLIYIYKEKPIKAGRYFAGMKHLYRKYNSGYVGVSSA